MIRALTDAWIQRQPGAASEACAQSVRALQKITTSYRPSGLRVLIVEDNPVNQRVASRLLERLGTRADVAGNGREALAMTQELPYDVVFMDCQMPEMDGYEAARRIREMEGPNRNVQIIALTADVLEGSRERCLAAGMNGFIAKPTKLSDFIAVLGDRLVQAPEEFAVS